MFHLKTQTEKTGLDEAIDSALTDLQGFTAETEEYARTVDQLTKLYAIKDQERPKSVSPDTLAIVAGNLLGIVVIVGHERANVVTSKALNFVLKLR
jgi:hypothetical protein